MSISSQELESVGELEAKLKGLLKEGKPHSHAEVQSLRRKLCDGLGKLILSQPSSPDAVEEMDERNLQLTERLWKLCFHKIIDEYRRQIPKETTNKTHVVYEFRRFLSQSSQFFETLSQKLDFKQQFKTRSRVFTCLGDLARYREMVSDLPEKRWNEAFDCYLASSMQWPESGSAQNQLAVLATYQNRFLLAAYRYQRALACNFPFEASKGNLSQMLNKVVASAVKAEGGAPLDTFLARVLRLEALLLLAEPAVDLARAELGLLRAGIQSVMKQLKKDVSVALLLSFAFIVTNLDVIAPHQSADKAVVAADAFRLFAKEFTRHASEEVTQWWKAGKRDAKASAKAILYVCLILDFNRAHPAFHVLDDECQAHLDALEGVLSTAELLGDEGNDEVERIDEEEMEYVGFLPLNLSSANVSFASSTEEVLRFRAKKISLGVREMVAAELNPLTLDGQIFSAPVALLDDDEEEEIVFRPAFKKKPDPVVPMVSLPPMFGLGQDTTWGGFQQLQPPQTAPPQLQASRWAFAAPTPLNVPVSEPTKVPVRRPPGF